MIKNLFKGCLTVPNLLSALRIVMVPIFAVLFYKGYPGLAVFVLFLSGFSDFLDGKIARRFNQISDLGKILDPVADKLTQITIAVMLFIEFNSCENTLIRAFSWIFLVFLIKEVIMVVGGAVMLACGIRPGAAEIYGKVATFVFYAVMLLLICFGPEVGALKNLFVLPDWLTVALIALSAALTLVAFASYLPETFRQFREKSKEKDKELQQS